jgi:hypothetical protein
LPSRRTSLAAPLLLVGRGSFAASVSTVVQRRVGPVDFQILLPPAKTRVRGLYVHAAHYRLKERDRWAASALSLGFGHVAMSLDLKTTDRPAKLATALDQGLTEVAHETRRDELPSVPRVGVGHSAGGLVGPALLRSPARTLALAIDCGWITDPTTLQEDAHAIPMLFTLGAVPDAFQMLPGIDARFRPARERTLPWTLGLKWGVAHDFGNAGALILPWIECVASTRLRSRQRLASVARHQDWRGELPTADGVVPRIAPAASFRRDRAPSVWLPNEAIAQLWRAFHAPSSAPVLEVSSADGARSVRPAGSRGGRTLVVGNGERVTLTVARTATESPSDVVFRSGDAIVARGRTGMPATFRVSPGSHGVYAEVENRHGRRATTSPVLVVAGPWSV